MPIPESHFESAVGHILGPYEKLSLSVSYFLNVCVISMYFIVLQNLGWWNILLYVWPEDDEYLLLVRDWLYTGVGIGMQVLVERWLDTKQTNDLCRLAWENGLPRGFDVRRKLTFFVVWQLEQFAFLVFWVGLWEILDNRLGWEISMERDLMYFFCAIPPLFVCSECLSRESLCWMAAHLQLWKKRREAALYDDEMPLVKAK